MRAHPSDAEPNRMPVTCSKTTLNGGWSDGVEGQARVDHRWYVRHRQRDRTIDGSEWRGGDPHGPRDRHFAVNVKAPFFLVGALAPGMASRGDGVIINVSTMVASFGQPGMSAYGASRAAVELLTKAWAAEYGPQGIRVNAVSPGPTRTPAMEPVMAMAEELVKTIPLGRVAETHELSDVITFLATPAAGYINGAIIHVDGGRTAV